MAKAAPKKGRMKKTAAKSSAVKKPVAKKVAMASTPSVNPSPSRNPMMIALLLGAVLIGIVLGMIFSSTNNAGMADADFDAKVSRYIESNAGTVIAALNNHMKEQADVERQQALNLVKGNDGKTVLGNPDGDVTIYEFSDYNCGYCKRAFPEVMAALEEDGNIRLVIKEFPILSETSLMAAQISMAAAELGQFEEMHTALMNWRGALDKAALEQIVREQGLDLNELAIIINKGEIDAALATTKSIAQQIQITGTPGFVIGNQIAPGYIPKEQILDLVRMARSG